VGWKGFGFRVWYGFCCWMDGVDGLFICLLKARREKEGMGECVYSDEGSRTIGLALVCGWYMCCLILCVKSLGT
jgi:hypothetical protein